jgi:hypothetical protein
LACAIIIEVIKIVFVIMIVIVVVIIIPGCVCNGQWRSINVTAFYRAC